MEREMDIEGWKKRLIVTTHMKSLKRSEMLREEVDAAPLSFSKHI
jgi:hypothetical protein